MEHGTSRNRVAAEYFTALRADPLLVAAVGAMLVLDTDLRIRATNPAYLGLIGRRKDNLVGVPLTEIHPPRPLGVGAAGAGNLQRSLREVLRHGRRHRMRVQDYDLPCADGFVRVTWAVTNSPLLRDGRLLGVLHEVSEASPRPARHPSGRATVNQAVGMLMGWHGCSADEAFAVLRRFAENHDVPLREVAIALVEEGSEPSGMDALADLDWLLTGISLRVWSKTLGRRRT